MVEANAEPNPKYGRRTYQKTVEAEKRLQDLMAEYPNATHAKLAELMGVSTKTIQRLKEKLRAARLDSDYIPNLGLNRERQMSLLIWLVQVGGRASIDMALDFFRDEFKKVTLQRIIADMHKHGLIQEKDGYLEIGEKLLPCLNLNEQEYDYLAGFIKNYATRFPLGPQLEQALNKICLGIPEPSWEIMQKRNFKREDRTLLKGAASHCSPATNALAEELLKLIKDRWYLQINYRSKKGLLKLSLQPQGVIYNWLNGGWYLAGLNLETGHFEKYRFDRLLGFEKSKQSEAAFPSLPEELKLSWGVEDGPRYQVMVRFANHYNVHDKVRLDCIERPTAVLQECADGSLLFSDQVLGLQEIRRWLRQFGASAEVLKPIELRKMMHESAGRCLVAYGVLPTS